MDLKAGDRFNSFIVMDEVPIVRNSKRWWSVRCDCGAEVLRRKDHLISGRTQCCKSCSAKKTAAKYGMPDQSKYIGDLGGTYYCMLRAGADKRGIPFEVSKLYLWELLVSQQFKCALTGITINLTTKVKNGSPDYAAFTASPDRIDSSKGYIEGNLQWVHKTINRMKNSHSQEYFIELCTLVNNYANQQPSTGNDLQDVPVKVQRLGGEDDQSNNLPTSAQPRESWYKKLTEAELFGDDIV